MQASFIGLGQSEPPLTLSDSQEILEAAIQRYLDAGLPLELASELENATISIVDLPNSYLGYFSDGRLILDIDGAGHGWFVDPTPLDDEEFDEDGIALPQSSNSDEIDLLSVVLHELAHSFGAGHSDDPSSLLYELIDVGQRKTVSHEIVDQIIAGHQ